MYFSQCVVSTVGFVFEVIIDFWVIDLFSLCLIFGSSPSLHSVLTMTEDEIMRGSLNHISVIIPPVI